VLKPPFKKQNPWTPEFFFTKPTNEGERKEKGEVLSVQTLLGVNIAQSPPPSLEIAESESGRGTSAGESALEVPCSVFDEVAESMEHDTPAQKNLAGSQPKPVLSADKTTDFCLSDPPQQPSRPMAGEDGMMGDWNAENGHIQ